MTTRIRIGKQTELSTLAGSLVVTDLSNEQEYLAPGALGDVLTSNGPGVLPSYQTPTSAVSKGYFSGVIIVGAAVTRYNMINNSFTSGVATESTYQVPSFAGTYSNLRINVSTNTATSAVTVNFRVNGAGAGPTISIPAATIGPFSNSTAITVATGDLVAFETVGAAVGSVIFGYQLEFIPS